MNYRVLLSGAMVLGIAGLLSGSAMAQQRPTGDLPGPIDNARDLQDTAKMVFKMADTNNDGQISQKEAVDAGNLLVGGFFFRADANGDGVLDQQEAMAAREQLFRQQPLMRYIFEKAKPQQGVTASASSTDPAQIARNLAANPAQAIGSMLDSNKDQKIEATELRQAVQQGVQLLFQVADANQDGQISPVELNRTAGEMAKAATQIAFQTADLDRNGAISMAEFDKALIEPAHAGFRVLDGNNDGQLSLEELQRAQQIIADQIRRLQMPDAPNAPINALGSGTTTGLAQPAAVPTTCVRP
jgi:Ca2+-binding EF-hand superfamily protein